MIIDCVADLHGFYPELEGGGLLIIAGDLTATDTPIEYQTFKAWLLGQNYEKKIVIAGNHDNYLLNSCDSLWIMPGLEYLCDSGTEFEGLKIWGSPWTKTFKGMNPLCKAFSVDTEEELEEKWALIPDDTDILVTHSPPYQILDTIKVYGPFSHEREANVGSESLLMKASGLPNLKLFACGHIHEGYGVLDTRMDRDELKHLFPNPICKSFPIIVNAPHVNERYKPVNKPIRIEL